MASSYFQCQISMMSGRPALVSLLRHFSSGIFMEAVLHVIFEAVPSSISPIPTSSVPPGSGSHPWALTHSVSLQLDRNRPWLGFWSKYGQVKSNS